VNDEKFEPERIVYWTCTDKSHRHFSKQEALRCLGIAEFLDAAYGSECLSIRTINCLRAANISTIEEIRIAFREGWILRVPNIGRKSEREVVEFLQYIDSKKKKVSA
jgi:DNA-directed RNA polymerase alpha subunit